jgi:tRNA G18 (ribose-2'-O)-methylase SpoU
VASLLIAEGRVAALEPVIAKLGETPVFVASQEVLNGIAGFDLHRGVLALAERGDDESVDELLSRLMADLHPDLPLSGGGVGAAGVSSPPPERGRPGGGLVVLVLIGVTDHDNIGACFRNAAALGAEAVILDATSSDPLYRKSIRVSSGAVLQLPFACGSSDEILAALQASGFEAWALTPSGGEELHTLRPSQRLALLLGAEGPGLPESVLSRARRVSIPMRGGMDSLNVATAGAIALAHIGAHRS